MFRICEQYAARQRRSPRSCLNCSRRASIPVFNNAGFPDDHTVSGSQEEIFHHYGLDGAGLAVAGRNLIGQTLKERKKSIYETFVTLAHEGMAVVVVSSDLEEVIGLANQVLVLARGIPQGILKHSDATNVAIMELATRKRGIHGGTKA